MATRFFRFDRMSQCDFANSDIGGAVRDLVLVFVNMRSTKDYGFSEFRSHCSLFVLNCFDGAKHY